MNPSIILYGQNVPKISVERNVLEMGVASTVINFNDGNCDILNVFTNGGMQTGYFTKMFCLKKDESRIQRMDKKTNKQRKQQQKSNEKDLAIRN